MKLIQQWSPAPRQRPEEPHHLPLHSGDAPTKSPRKPLRQHKTTCASNGASTPSQHDDENRSTHQTRTQPHQLRICALLTAPVESHTVSLTAALGRGDPSPLNGLTRVVSTTNWTHRTVASLQPQSPNASRRARWAPRGPDHAQAHWWQLVRPHFPLQTLTSPTLLHAARWWSKESRIRPHRQVRETGGRGKRKRRNSRTLNNGESMRVAGFKGVADNAAPAAGTLCDLN